MITDAPNAEHLVEIIQTAEGLTDGVEDTLVLLLEATTSYVARHDFDLEDLMVNFILSVQNFRKAHETAAQMSVRPS